MKAGRSRIFAHAQMLVVLLATVIAFGRAIVPSGYMLDRAEDDGRLIVRMCGGLGSQSILLPLHPNAHAAHAGNDHGGQQSGHGKRHADDSSCTFALSAVADVPVGSLLAAPVAHEQLLQTAPPALVRTVAWLSRPPLPGRGPPAAA